MSLSLQHAHSLTLVVGADATAGAALTGLSGAVSTYSTSAINFVIAGVPYTKAAASLAASPTVDTASGAAITMTASEARAIIWAVNASGTVAVFAGPVVTYTGTGDVQALQKPVLPAGYAAIAEHTLMAESTLSGTWTFGSSLWNATGMTVGTVRNLAGVVSPAPLLTA